MLGSEEGNAMFFHNLALHSVLLCSEGPVRFQRIPAFVSLLLFPATVHARIGGRG